MIITGKKKYFYFFIFIFPALFFNVLFFLIPLIQTVLFSFTDIRGTSPFIPVLPSLQTNQEKAETVHCTGLQNFRNMFNPALDQRFMPSENTHYLFKENYELPLTMDMIQYKKMLAEHIKDKKKLARLEQAYTKLDNTKYGLNAEYNEFELFDDLTALAGGEQDKCILLLEEIKEAAFAGRPPETVLEKARISPGFQKFSAADRSEWETILNRYYALFEVKKILSRYLIKKEIMPGVVGFTLLYTGINMVLANLIALLIAFGLSRKTRFFKAMRLFFFLPGIMSCITVSFVWSVLFEKILPSVTGIEVLIGNPELAPLLVAFAGAWRSSSCLILIYLAGMESIHTEYLEAAVLAGADARQLFFRIILPLLLPAITAGIFWSFFTSLQIFDISFVLTGTSGYANNTVSLVLDIYINAFTGNRLGYAAAKALLLCAVVSVPAGIRLFFMKKREINL